MSQESRQLIIGILAFAALIGIVMIFSRRSSLAPPTPTPSPQSKSYSSPPSLSIDKSKTYTAILTTSLGEITVELFPKTAPNTVNNFVFLAREHYYDQTPFHRIIKGFMVQGGDPTGTGRGNPGYKFADEKITRAYKRGVIAMANSGPNTNGSQFFIMHADYDLPKYYVIFGAVPANHSKSFAALDAIASVPVVANGMGENSRPKSPVILKSVIIEEK